MPRREKQPAPAEPHAPAEPLPAAEPPLPARGPRPGPGGPPIERLLALLDALLDLLERHGDLLYTAETSKAEARYATGAYAAWHRHVAVLLGELGVAGDPEVL